MCLINIKCRIGLKKDIKCVGHPKIYVKSNKDEDISFCYVSLYILHTEYEGFFQP